jgi:hypothetical protein
MDIIDSIKTLPIIERTSEWKDRHYVTMTAARGSRSNADLKAKLWIKGDVLTIESAKGYHSDQFIADKHALIEAVKAAGGSVREI